MNKIFEWLGDDVEDGTVGQEVPFSARAVFRPYIPQSGFVPGTVHCPPGTVRNQFGQCVSVIPPGFETPRGPGVGPSLPPGRCPPGYVMTHSGCRKLPAGGNFPGAVLDFGCSPGQAKNAAGQCVPVYPATCPPGFEIDYAGTKQCVPIVAQWEISIACKESEGEFSFPEIVVQTGSIVILEGEKLQYRTVYQAAQRVFNLWNKYKCGYQSSLIILMKRVARKNESHAGKHCRFGRYLTRPKFWKLHGEPNFNTALAFVQGVESLVRSGACPNDYTVFSQ